MRDDAMPGPDAAAAMGALEATATVCGWAAEQTGDPELQAALRHAACQTSDVAAELRRTE
jgi:hypothetical protein